MPRILITGVSSGIGRACANLYAERSWNVIGTVRDPTRRTEGLDRRVVLYPLDLAVRGSATALAKSVLAREGRGEGASSGAACPDVLLNNAGSLAFGPLEDVSPEDLERIYQVNVFGQLELIDAFLPAMRERGSAVIANVTSLGGTITFPFFGAYNSTKWAMEGISEGLWHELQPFGIRVKAIEPGFVQTDIWRKALPGAGEDILGTPGYEPGERAMIAFESRIKRRTSPEDCAVEIADAVADQSDRLRYPVAAYARPITRARRWLGAQRMMRFFHRRWTGT